MALLSGSRVVFPAKPDRTYGVLVVGLVEGSRHWADVFDSEREIGIVGVAIVHDEVLAFDT